MKRIKPLSLFLLTLGIATVVRSQAPISPVLAKVCTGTNANFSVTATGSTITYQWQESIDGGITWNNLLENSTTGVNPANGIYTGTTTAALLITRAPSTMNGNKYRNNVSINGGSAVASNVAVLNVGPDANLDATTTTNCPNTSNTINTAGAAGVTYQWQVSTNSGASWANVVAGTDPSGAVYTVNTSSLVISSLTNAIDGYQYRYIANDGAGCIVTSGATTQKVPALAVFTLPSGSITANPGDAVNIPVTVTAGTSPFTYQWQVAVGAGAYSSILTTNTAYTGPTTSILGIPSFTSAMYSNKYRVIIKNSGGCTSASASFVQIGVPVVLALNITSFTAERLNSSTAKLSWTVDGPGAGQSFSIQRSVDNVSYIEAGRVKGVQGINSYSFIDAGVTSPDVQYRLKASDESGASVYSNVVKLSNDSVARRIGLRPSFTTSGSTSLYTVLAKEETLQLTVTDIMGRVQFSKMLSLGRGENYTPLNVSRLAKGIYYVRVSSLDGVAQTLSFVKD
jgi:hypothetical protein